MNANRTPSWARGTENLPPAEEDPATYRHQHVCCEGTEGPSGSPGTHERLAGQRPGYRPCCPLSNPSSRFSLKSLAPCSGHGARTHQAGETFKNNKWLGRSPRTPPGSPFPDPGPASFTQNTPLPSVTCHLIPSKGDIALQTSLQFRRSVWGIMKKRVFSDSTSTERRSRKGWGGESTVHTPQTKPRPS